MLNRRLTVGYRVSSRTTVVASVAEQWDPALGSAGHSADRRGKIWRHRPVLEINTADALPVVLGLHISTSC